MVRFNNKIKTKFNIVNNETGNVDSLEQGRALFVID
jgi:hypothetical protein